MAGPPDPWRAREGFRNLECPSVLTILKLNSIQRSKVIRSLHRVEKGLGTGQSGHIHGSEFYFFSLAPMCSMPSAQYNPLLDGQ
jgi:hypothetical protein